MDDAEAEADPDAAGTDGVDGNDDDTTDLELTIEELFERAEKKLELVASKPDEDELGPVLSVLDDLEDIADEAEDIVSTADLTELAGTVDWDALPEAFELEDLPDAIESGDRSEVVTLRKLIELVDLPKLWQSVDARELWREKREFENEVDDLTDDDGDADENGGGDDGGLSMPDTGPHDVDPESLENAVQSGMSDAVDTFRSKLIDAHEQIRAVREANRERFPDHRRNRSRNPTAVTTMPARNTAASTGTIHSSVPEETRYSTAPNRRRIYGTRFEKARDDE
jgi:hypothetical protein